MGYAIAQALSDLGANVTLVTGLTELISPVGVRTLEITTASQMFDAVKANLADVDLFFAVAAVADYTPAVVEPQKIKKTASNMSIELVATTDILAWVASQPSPPFSVGFAAESQNVVEYARKKREKKRIPMIVANLATSAIGADQNEVTIIDDDGEHAIAKASKASIAKSIVEHAARLFAKSRGTHARPVQSSSLKSVKNA
jgi:phosphopantothenoylcysteine decarboxylase/phosphopantothenate--cysteine ligase